MKNKILKTCFVGCLATCLTLTGIFAFAPHGANAQASSSSQNSSLNNNVNNSTTSTTESAGLITPRDNDPVLFTTENGIEIKYGNSTLSSGTLKGFLYFRTTKNSTNYDWVLIGSRYFDMITTFIGVEYNIWSDWRSTLIRIQNSPNNFILHEEIPEDYWLILLNNAIGSYPWAYNQEQAWTTTMLETHNSFSTQDTFGFGDKLSFIPQTTTIGIYSRNGKEASGTSRFFLLDAPNVNTNFKINSYLTSDLYVAPNAKEYWLRSQDVGTWNTFYVDAYGYIKNNSSWGSNGAKPLRPACLIYSGDFYPM